MTPENVPPAEAASRAMTLKGTLSPFAGLFDLNRASPARLSQGSTVMKIVTALFVVAAFAVTAESAEAKGCLKGAVVGGVAGHYAGHHGVLGAAAGCLYGRHRAKEQERQQQQTQNQDPPIDHGTSGM
jgi:outer membrane lipoprotein SlyB